MDKEKQLELIQQAVDDFKDLTKRRAIIAAAKESGMSLEQHMRLKYGYHPDGRHVLQCVMHDGGIDITRAMLTALGSESDIRDKGDNFWSANHMAEAFRALCDHVFYDNYLDEANPYTGEYGSTLRYSHVRFAPPAQRRDTPNTVGAIEGVGEPVITYQERPARDSERTEFGPMIQDIIAEVVPMPAGTLDARQVISKVDFDEENMEVILEGTAGPLVSISAAKDEWGMNQYRLNIARTDEFAAGQVRMTLYMRTIARIGRWFSRACLIRGMNAIAADLKTGNTRYGEAYTQDSSETAMTGQHWGKIEDSYEVETMNRVIAKKAAIRALKEMNMGTENQTYSQYMQRPTNFYDVGGAGTGDIGRVGVNSGALDAAFTDKTFFTFDVMSTLILITCPWLEQDEDQRDAPTGNMLRSIRTAALEVVEDNNSVRKGSWS